MKKGDIIFVQGNSIVSKVIRWLDRDENGDVGKFSHVAIAINELQAVEAEYSSNISVVNVINKYEKANFYEIKSLNIGNEEKYKIKESALKFVGRKYDYIQIFTYIFNKLFGWKIKNNRDRFICSELVIASMYDAGLLEGYNYNSLIDLTPNQLHHFITSYIERERG